MKRILQLLGQFLVKSAKIFFFISCYIELKLFERLGSARFLQGFKISALISNVRREAQGFRNSVKIVQIQVVTILFPSRKLKDCNIFVWYFGKCSAYVGSENILHFSYKSCKIKIIWQLQSKQSKALNFAENYSV